MCKMTLIVKGSPDQAIEACHKRGLAVLDSAVVAGSTRVGVLGSFLTVGAWFSEPPYLATPEKPYPAGSLLFFRCDGDK